jgi:hypothetical protein
MIKAKVYGGIFTTKIRRGPTYVPTGGVTIANISGKNLAYIPAITRDPITEATIQFAASGGSQYNNKAMTSITMTTSGGQNKIISLLDLATLFTSDIPFQTDGQEPVIDEASILFKIHKISTVDLNYMCRLHLGVVMTAPASTFSTTQSATPYPAILDSALNTQYQPENTGMVILKDINAFWRVDDTTFRIYSLAECQLDITGSMVKLIKRKADAIYKGIDMPKCYVYISISHPDNNQVILVASDIRIAYHYEQKQRI